MTSEGEGKTTSNLQYSLMQLCLNGTFGFAVTTFIDYTHRLYDRNQTQMNKPAVSLSQPLFSSFDINDQQSIDLWEAWGLEGVAGADGVAIGVVVAVAVKVTWRQSLLAEDLNELRMSSTHHCPDACQSGCQSQSGFRSSCPTGFRCRFRYLGACRSCCQIRSSCLPSC